MPKTLRCDHCFFAVEQTDPPEMAECHRNPPLVTGGMMSSVETVWPVVNPGDYCGEFRTTPPSS